MRESEQGGVMSEASFDQSRFNEVLAIYAEVCEKDLATILNTKAYYVARKALWFTKKVDRKTIFALAHEATRKRARAPQGGGLMVGAMISKRRGVGRGLYGKPMEAAFERVIASRIPTIAFLKSGWLPAIRGLAALAENPNKAGPMDRSARQGGADKGRYVPAVAGRLSAMIESSSQAKSDTKGALGTIGKRGLEFAFEDEARSMGEYIERKLAQRAVEANQKL